MTADDGASVVVAVGDATTDAALDWAAAEASARRCRLRVVHVEHLRWAVDPSGLVPVADFQSFRETAVDILRAALRRARSVAPDLDISTELGFGPTVPVLLCRSVDAQLLVLGSRIPPFQSRLGDRLAFTVCGRIVRRAPCPVAIVRPLRNRPHAGPPPQVVVGVDGGESSAPALHVAFRAAAQRGVPLTAVHAWTPALPAAPRSVRGHLVAREARAVDHLQQTLEPWRIRFPDVPVSTRLLIGEPAAVVIRESEGAALAVIGSRARGAARGTLFDSVSRRVARRARCPVVLVRTGTARPPSRLPPRRDTAVRGAPPSGIEPVHRRRTPWD
jgi:nucleotide-binding universal stress UspA family protein